VICIGEVYYDFQDIQNAIFAFNEACLIADRTLNDKYKIHIYISLANCCFKAYKFKDALLILKKAIQYA